MEFKMLLVNFGIFFICFMKPVQLAKDSMQLSSFTFLWEDAEARCARQDQILAPGRRYRAKLIKKLMVKENINAVWLNGWRAVSDIKPDNDGKLSTLKVDFSRPQNKQLKMICQYDSQYYDPTYQAESTEIARTACERDGAKLAEVTTEDDVLQITKDMIVDKPHWINSISSQGSKIKQCLVAKLIGDDLKYSYEDCGQEYNFFCVQGDDIISSFSPLISLKMARFEEFEEEIEKHTQSMATSTDVFDFFPTSVLPSESSSLDLPSPSITSTPQPPMTSKVAAPSVQPEMTSADVTSSVQPLVTPSDFTSSVQLIVTSDTATSSITIETSSSVVVYDEDTSVMDSIQPTPSYTEMTATVDDILPSKADTPSSPIPSSSNGPVPVTSSVDLSSTEYMAGKLPTLNSDIIDIQSTSIVEDTKETKTMLVSSSQFTESSIIDKYYRESVFIEPEISTATERYTTDMVTSSITEEISPMLTSEVSSPSIFINATGYQSAIDTPVQTATDTVVVQTTQIITPALSSSSYFKIFDKDEPEGTMSIASVDTGEVLTAQATSASVSQTPVIIQPSSTQTIMPKLDTDSEEYPTLPPIVEPTTEYTTSTTDEYEKEDVDEDIPGDLDEDDDMDEDNEVGNASAGTGEIVEKKEGDEDEGTEVGLWVAFAILITLVLIALILAAYLYRKRKQEKSKDINEAVPPAATGETVELRDSRSPSRENGKPRESTTFKDPAYEI